MKERALHWLRRLLIVLVLGLVAVTIWPVEAQRGGASGRAAVRTLLSAAAEGGFRRADDLYSELTRLGLSELEANRAIEDISRAYQRYQDRNSARSAREEARRQAERDEEEREREREREEEEQREEEERTRDQNMSGAADWNFGPVFRDRDYPVTMPVENNCRLPQSFTITYPKAVMLDGPTTVDVPPKSKVDVKMMLTMTKPPMPSGPFPPGLSLSCYDLNDTLTLVHPELKITTAKSEYVCHEMTRTLTISMHVHAHGPPDASGGGGGGPGGPLGASKACEIYWNSDDFFVTPAVRDPEQCVDEIRALAGEFFGPMLESRRAEDPAAWDWVPTADEIGQRSVAELKMLKARADELAAPRYLP